MPLQATSGAASYDAFGGGVPIVPVYIEEVFSTYLYTGNAPTGQTITNGVDLSTNGGLVWIKSRANSSRHVLTDTARGVAYQIYSNFSDAQNNTGGSYDLTSFNNNGFTLGSNGYGTNITGSATASWTFRKQPKFFDVVTWTGTGSNRTIAHNLGSVPGCIIVKRTNTTGDWMIYHRSIANTQYYNFAYTGTPTTDSTVWNSTTATSSVFSLGTNSNVNASGSTYVAYVFAHDAGGFGLTGTDNVITCGSFTTDGSGNATVNLGYEPQFVMLQRQDDDWFMNDSMRGMPAPPSGSGTNANLLPDSSNAESINGRDTSPTSTGFVARMGSASKFCIYIAIRRGPMKVPTSGTSVFNTVLWTGNETQNRQITGVGFNADYVEAGTRGAAITFSRAVVDRLRGVNQFISTALTNSEASGSDLVSFNNDGITVNYADSGSFNNASNIYGHFFRRAPSFFDVVCYTGTGANQTLPHNLGAVPELMITKNRSNSSNWRVYDAFNGPTKRGSLNDSQPWDVQSTMWNDTAPTSTVFTVGTSNSASSQTYVIYLFATCAGVSKVGSYTGTATTKQIDCGFTGGARFVLIKRTDDTGSWYVWDSARGIVSGNDPYLLLNSTAAEVTNTDYIDTYSAGFEISSTAPSEINASGGTFIFLAIA